MFSLLVFEASLLAGFLEGVVQSGLFEYAVDGYMAYRGAFPV